MIKSQFYETIARARVVFESKARVYGASWKVMRLPSLTDQLFIKARRIRTIEETGVNLVGDSIEQEWIGILNYCVIALLLAERHVGGAGGSWDVQDPPLATVLQAYDEKIEAAWQTLLRKNHDYGEAWRDMRPSSFTDLVLMKILRLKQLEDNRAPITAEYLSIYIDIINYSVFFIKICQNT